MRLYDDSVMFIDSSWGEQFGSQCGHVNDNISLKVNRIQLNRLYSFAKKKKNRLYSFFCNILLEELHITDDCSSDS